jgi:mRNA-degrading endonuclease RelE of RelBE toxin-antitoxin system
MEIKYTAQFLHKLEDIFAESDYMLRYEKGNFKSGYCILKDNRIVIINKYFTTEGKVNCLIDILRSVRMDISRLSEKNKKIHTELTGTVVAQ